MHTLGYPFKKGEKGDPKTLAIALLVSVAVFIVRMKRNGGQLKNKKSAVEGDGTPTWNISEDDVVICTHNRNAIVLQPSGNIVYQESGETVWDAHLSDCGITTCCIEETGAFGLYDKNLRVVARIGGSSDCGIGTYDIGFAVYPTDSDSVDAVGGFVIFDANKPSTSSNIINTVRPYSWPRGTELMSVTFNEHTETLTFQNDGNLVHTTNTTTITWDAGTSSTNNGLAYSVCRVEESGVLGLYDGDSNLLVTIGQPSTSKSGEYYLDYNYDKGCFVIVDKVNQFQSNLLKNTPPVTLYYYKSDTESIDLIPATDTSSLRFQPDGNIVGNNDGEGWSANTASMGVTTCRIETRGTLGLYDKNSTMVASVGNSGMLGCYCLQFADDGKPMIVLNTDVTRVANILDTALTHLNSYRNDDTNGEHKDFIIQQGIYSSVTHQLVITTDRNLVHKSVDVNGDETTVRTIWANNSDVDVKEFRVETNGSFGLYDDTGNMVGFIGPDFYATASNSPYYTIGVDIWYTSPPELFFTIADYNTGTFATVFNSTTPSCLFLSN